MNRLRRLVHRHKPVLYELVEDYLPVTSTDGSSPVFRTEGPKVWYIGYRCANKSCDEPLFKVGPLGV